jgi:hypothetical protein
MDIEKQITQKLFYDDTPLFLKRAFIKGLQRKAKLIDRAVFVDTQNFKLNKTEIYQYKNFLYKINSLLNLKNQNEKIDIYKIEIKKEGYDG